MAKLFKLPKGLQLHSGGRKVWRDLAPLKIIEPALPAIEAGAVNLKSQIQVAKARLDSMPDKTAIEKKVYDAHKVKADKMEDDLVDYEALLAAVTKPDPPKPKAKAKK